MLAQPVGSDRAGGSEAGVVPEIWMAEHPQVGHVSEIGLGEAAQAGLAVADVGGQHDQAETLAGGLDHQLERGEGAPCRDVRVAGFGDHALVLFAPVDREPAGIRARTVRVQAVRVGRRDVAGEDHRDELEPDQILGRLSANRQRPDGDVRLPLRQIVGPAVRGEAQLDLRVGLAERRELMQQQVGDVVVAAGQLDRARQALVLARQAALQGRHLALDALGASEHLAAGLGESVSVAVPIEEARGEASLQRFNPPGDRRVADAQGCSRGPDRSHAGERQEVPNVAPVHRLGSITGFPRERGAGASTPSSDAIGEGPI